jgi:hypothetical protein
VNRSSDTVFRVVVKDADGRTFHDVTATNADLLRYGGQSSPEQVIKASFEFLLEREPKESILHAFALPVIESYFPDYPAEIRKRLKA